MSSHKSRRATGVHLGRKARKRIRTKLVVVFGNKCCWCNKKMVIPETGKDIQDLMEMATIEHYFAKVMGDPNNIALLRLAHKKCNI